MSHKSRKDKQQHATPAPGKQAVPGAAPGWHFADKARSEQEQLASVMQWVLDTLPMAVWWKNRDSVWQGGNIYFARETGVESPRQLVGRRDHEFFPKEHLLQFYLFRQKEVSKCLRPMAQNLHIF